MLISGTSDKDNGVMRYLIQFVIPALILLGVVYAVTRRRRQPNHDHDDGAAVFLTILVIGAVVAVATLFVLQVNWNDL
jgi:hypothetical protein